MADLWFLAKKLIHMVMMKTHILKKLSLALDSSQSDPNSKKTNFMLVFLFVKLIKVKIIFYNICYNNFFINKEITHGSA